MFAILARCRPLDLATQQRVDVLVMSAPGPAWGGLGGLEWEPAIVQRPRGTFELASLDLSAGLKTASCEIVLSLSAIRNVNAGRLYWNGAPVTIYRADNLAWPAPILFTGTVQNPSRDLLTDRLTLNMVVNTDALAKDLLSGTFNGDGQAGGDADKYGTLWPIGFGNCPSVEPVMFDTTRNIGMLDGYGNLLNVTWLAEGLSSFGPSQGNYASYAALAAAIDAKTIKPGQWATSFAAGLIGLGAPPVGVVTCNAQFRYGMTGALMKHLLLAHAGLSADQVLGATFDFLDTGVPYPIHFWTGSQTEIRPLLEAFANACNATPIISLQGQHAVSRIFGGAIAAAFQRNGFNDPLVTKWVTNDPIPPFYQIKMRTARPVRVLETNEVLYEDNIVNRGTFDITETYRQGNEVWTADGAQWLYINGTPAAGHIPPADLVPDSEGLVADAWWQRLKPPTTEQFAQAYRDAQPIDPTPPLHVYKKGDIGLNQGAHWIYAVDLAWDGTMPPPLPVEGNTYWTLVKDAATISISSNVTAVTIRTDYQRAPLTGQLPSVGRAKLLVGAADVSSSVAWSATTSGCTASIDTDGSWQITAVSTDGYVDFKATFGGEQYVTRVTVVLDVAAPPATGGGGGGGGGGGTAPDSIITTFPSISTSTYPSAPTATATATAGAGGIKFDGALTYSVAPASGGKVARLCGLAGKMVYRVSGSSSGWTDVTAEVTGSVANSGASPDYESADGELYFPATTITSVTSGTVYEYGVLLRRFTGAGSTTPQGFVEAAHA